MRSALRNRVRSLLSPGAALDPAPIPRDAPSAPRGGISGAVWRGGIGGAAFRPDGSRDEAATKRLRQELQYWSRASKNEGGEFEGSLEQTFRRWQRIRLYELARCLGMHGGLEVGGPLVGEAGEWLSRQRAVEIGGGPWPCLAAARFASALVIDPLADGYHAEGLITAEADQVVYLAAAGERVPLPTGRTDLVVTDNCLDHVEDPAEVAREMARVLRPGGLLWLLVDVMDEADEMHPHPMSESKAAGLLVDAGLTQRWGEVWDGHSHPRAKGQWRTLWEKPG